MPEKSRAADEHALLAEVTEPLAHLPHGPPPITPQPDFPIVLRGYDRLTVDAYVRRTSELVAEFQAVRSPEAAVRRALERVGEQIAGILQRAHDTASEITSGSRREAEDRLIAARREADQIVADARARLVELDADADRIWAERERIVQDTRALAHELAGVADAALERFPSATDPGFAPDPDAAPPRPRSAEDTAGGERQDLATGVHGDEGETVILPRPEIDE